MAAMAATVGTTLLKSGFRKLVTWRNDWKNAIVAAGNVDVFDAARDIIISCCSVGKPGGSLGSLQHWASCPILFFQTLNLILSREDVVVLGSLWKGRN